MESTPNRSITLYFDVPEKKLFDIEPLRIKLQSMDAGYSLNDKHKKMGLSLRSYSAGYCDAIDDILEYLRSL